MWNWVYELIEEATFPYGAPWTIPSAADKVIDLSSWVGTQRVWAVLAYGQYALDAGAGSKRAIGVRPADDADRWDDYSLTESYLRGYGCCALCNMPAFAFGDPSTFLAATDATGSIRIRANVATDGALWIIGYVDITHNPLGLIDGAIPGGWTNFDCSSRINELSFALIKDCQNIIMPYPEEHLLRPTSDAYNWEDSQISSRPPANKMGGALAGCAAGLMTVVDATGIVDFWTSALIGVTNADIDYLSSAPCRAPEVGHEILKSAAVPDALVWTAIDVGPATGYAGRCLLALKVFCDTEGLDFLHFRPRGLPLEADVENIAGMAGCRLQLDRAGLIIVSTDNDGFIEWINNVDTGAPCQHEIAVLGFIGGPPRIHLDSIEQTSLNTVDLVWNRVVRYLDPADATDHLYLPAYVTTSTGTVTRRLQAVTRIDEYTTRLWYDGPLAEGETHTVTITGLCSDIGELIVPNPTVGTFTAFGPDRIVIPLGLETADAVDIANPQVSRDALGGSLGTFRVDETGDLDTETKRAYLRKRILRRCMTGPGGFAFLAGYGLALGAKRLLRPGDLRRLQHDVEAQVAIEPDVVSVRAAVSQPYPGVVWLRLYVVDRAGPMTIETMIGGDDA